MGKCKDGYVLVFGKYEVCIALLTNKIRFCYFFKHKWKTLPCKSKKCWERRFRFLFHVIFYRILATTSSSPTTDRSSGFLLTICPALTFPGSFRLEFDQITIEISLFLPGSGIGGGGSSSPKIHAHGFNRMSSSPMDSSQPCNVDEFDMVWVPMNRDPPAKFNSKYPMLITIFGRFWRRFDLQKRSFTLVFQLS